MSCVTCHLSPVMCHLSHVTCHLSPVICHLSPVTCYESPWKFGDAAWGVLVIDRGFLKSQNNLNILSVPIWAILGRSSLTKSLHPSPIKIYNKRADQHQANSENGHTADHSNLKNCADNGIHINTLYHCTLPLHSTTAPYHCTLPMHVRCDT